LENSKITYNTPEEFKSLFDAHYKAIRNFVYYQTGKTDLADDIVQDVFVKIWEMREKIKPETVKALLYKIADNICKNHFKHEKVKYNFVSHADKENQSPENPEYQLVKKEFDRKLQDVLAQMPEKNRVVFLMNRIDEMTYQEIANRLELSVKAIEKRMHEALLYLKEKIQFKI